MCSPQPVAVSILTCIAMLLELSELRCAVHVGALCAWALLQMRGHVPARSDMVHVSGIGSFTMAHAEEAPVNHILVHSCLPCKCKVVNLHCLASYRLEV